MHRLTPNTLDFTDSLGVLQSQQVQFSPSERRLIAQLCAADCTILMHGSYAVSLQQNDDSDIDLVVTGELEQLISLKILNKTCRNALTNGEADYAVTRATAWDCPRLSLHLQPHKYRTQLLSKPQALEYRQNSSFIKVKEYIVCGITKKGDIFALAVQCPRVAAGDTHITRIPQTAIYVFESNQVCYAKSQPRHRYDIAIVDKPKSKLAKPTETPTDLKGTEFLLIGLELNKISEDILLHNGSSAGLYECVELPLTKCLHLIRTIVQADCVSVLIKSLRLRSRVRTRLHGKPPVSELFFKHCEQRLRALEKNIEPASVIAETTLA